MTGDRAGTVIGRLADGGLGDAAAGLAALLADAVGSGSSVGFLAPLDQDTAEAWWLAAAPALREGTLALYVARERGRVVGSVGVQFTDKPNGRHRAEIIKLLVHRDARGRGLGRALLATAERAAAEAGVTLLVLDTETGSPAERLYRTAGWTAVGVIPDYAADTAGALHPTTLFYKSLTAG